ncbi:MAG: hypothetical protein FJZ62_06265 [Chlamydiae bacterium]|nr:hypothetical protein [Chlamydiota bacterium]
MRIEGRALSNNTELPKEQQSSKVFLIAKSFFLNFKAITLSLLSRSISLGGNFLCFIKNKVYAFYLTHRPGRNPGEVVDIMMRKGLSKEAAGYLKKFSRQDSENYIRYALDDHLIFFIREGALGEIHFYDFPQSLADRLHNEELMRALFVEKSSDSLAIQLLKYFADNDNATDFRGFLNLLRRPIKPTTYQCLMSYLALGAPRFFSMALDFQKTEDYFYQKSIAQTLAQNQKVEMFLEFTEKHNKTIGDFHDEVYKFRTDQTFQDVMQPIVHTLDDYSKRQIEAMLRCCR